jgi:sugar lactone lactonase YvrE
MLRSILTVALLGAASVALAQTAPAPRPAAAPAAAPADVAKRIAQLESDEAAVQAALAFRAQRDLANETLAWERAVALRPHLGHYKVELAAAYAQQDKKRETYNALLELQAQGYAFQLKDDKRFAKVATTEVWTYTLKGFDANREPFGEGRVTRTLGRQHELIESLAWDPSRKQLLAGSARDGKVYRVGADGKLAPLVAADAQNGMWSVFDLVVDAERGVLWVASTAVPHYQDYDAQRDLGRAGVFKFDLATGKFLKKFLSPSIAGQSFFLSTLALGKDGEVYAADGVNNAVYQVRDDQFRRLFHAPLLGSIRGMAVSGDGKRLYLADHERGLIGFDLAAGKPFDVSVPKTLALGGIDGLAWWQDQLVVVQNSMQPTRVMRLKLSADGRGIAAVQPLAANQPELTLPTLGALAGEEFHFIANSQKGNYDRFGLVKDKSKLEGTRIYTVRVDYQPPAQQPAAPPAKTN